MHLLVFSRLAQGLYFLITRIVRSAFNIILDYWSGFNFDRIFYNQPILFSVLKNKLLTIAARYIIFTFTLTVIYLPIVVFSSYLAVTISGTNYQ